MAKGNSVASPVSADQHVSVSVRKIDNGFIARHSVDGPKGYSSTERFHTTAPKVTVGVGVAPKGKSGPAKAAPKPAAKAKPKGKPAAKAHSAHQRYR